MRGRTYELDGLLELPHLRDAGARRASFRQALANLARIGELDGPSPLEGVAPEALARGVKVALESELFDDLDWLSETAVGVALYELAAALPAGHEKRELGRRVLSRVHEGSAPVFAAVVTRMALGTRKGLAGAAIAARISLLFSLRGGSVDAGPLAFAFASRRELAREWIGQRSTGSLPSRRLASRIIEHAAVVAARRAAQGDDYAPRVFATEQNAIPFARLLADREPLVWRHAAVARGLLGGVSSAPWKAIVDALHPRFTPTEWRRAAVSIVAAIATSPTRALPRALDLLRGNLSTRDRGLAATMVWGLPRVFDVEPEAAEQLLDAVVDVDAAGAAEAIAAIAPDLSGEPGRRAVATARAILAERIAVRTSSTGEVDDERLVARALYEELSPEHDRSGTLRDAVDRALLAWSSGGAREAHAIAVEAMDVARSGVSALEGLHDEGDADGAAVVRRTAVLLLRDLDSGLLEDSSLGDLLHLRPQTGTAAEGPSIADLHDRLGLWLLARERARGTATEYGMSGRRLRALLHLVDHESAEGDDDASPNAARVRGRRLEAVRVLLDRLPADRRSPVHRTLCATLARAFDALVRDGTCEPVDVMMVSLALLEEGTDLATLGEASMDPDVAGALRACARFVRAITEEAIPLVTPTAGPMSFTNATTDERPTGDQRIEALLELAAALGDDGSGRAEALRAVLSRIARALQNVQGATARKTLQDGAGGSFDALAGAAAAYAQMEQGARRRVFGGAEDAPTSIAAVGLGGRIAPLLSRLADPAIESARSSVHEALVDFARALPSALSKLVDEVFRRALELPYESGAASASNLRVGEELPAWLGARRTIGGFYVVRPLGGGAAASVFVAKRIEERHDPNAERFALKVPDYDGAAARSLSEKEFLDFFRAEASALLGLPPDPNLARFVTFDLAARPKPILVMELIEGPTLERFVAAAETSNGKATTHRALEILDGVLAGLEKMHDHAIGHLDVKPSNVILREGKTPALVDFGLSGRHVRPGCATGPYGAPEVWGVLPEDFAGEPSPLPADMYAFGALAFEVLTGRTLFDGPNEVAIISRHLTHDGHPEALDAVAHVRPVMELIEQTLRRDPRQRWTAKQVRAGLRALTPAVAPLNWPLV